MDIAFADTAAELCLIARTTQTRLARWRRRGLELDLAYLERQVASLEHAAGILMALGLRDAEARILLGRPLTVAETAAAIRRAAPR